MKAEATISQTILGQYVVVDNIHAEIRASGSTPEEAVSRYRKAKDEWIATLRQRNAA